MQALSIVDNILRNIDQGLAMSSLAEETKEEEQLKPLLMIPGPIEFDQSVYESLCRKTVSHVAPSFIEEFGSALDRFREIIKGKENECEPFILSGGGSLGWDCIITSLCEPELKDRALILNGGYFSDNFRECAKAYGLEIDEIKASCIGDVVTPKQLEEYLSNKDNPTPKLICITHVDTSVAACTDVPGLATVCQKLSPSSFIAVDGMFFFSFFFFFFVS